MRFTAASLCVLFALVVVQAGAVTVDREFQETFDALEGDVISCRYGDGDVVVIPWDQETIDVNVRYHVDVRGFGIGEEPDFEIDMERVDNEIVIVGRETSVKAAIVRIRNVHEYRYTIHAPPVVALELSGDDGDVTIDGWRSSVSVLADDGDVTVTDVETDRVRVSVEDGDIELSDTIGELRVSGDDGDVVLTNCAFPLAQLKLADGDVAASGCDGRLEISVDDGDIALFGVTGESIEIRGEDGDVRIEYGDVGAVDLDVTLDDGDVDVLFGAGLSATLLVTTEDGRLSVAGDEVTDLRVEEERAEAVVGGGEGRMRLRTADGSVTIRQRR